MIILSVFSTTGVAEAAGEGGVASLFEPLVHE